jgi:hypothetical protein
MLYDIKTWINLDLAYHRLWRVGFPYRIVSLRLALLSSPVARRRAKLPIMVAYLDISLKFREHWCRENIDLRHSRFFIQVEVGFSLLHLLKLHFYPCRLGSLFNLSFHQVRKVYFSIGSLSLLVSWIPKNRFSKKTAITSIKNIHRLLNIRIHLSINA